MELYLEAPEAPAEGSPVFKNFRRMGDFLGLGKCLLFLHDPLNARLDLAAWTLEEEVPSYSMDLEPPLRIRLSADLPQVLSGSEKFALLDFAFQWTDKESVPIALPLVSPFQELLGTLILLDAPVFDLEDEDFVTCWNSLKSFLIKEISPGILPPTPRGGEVITQLLESGRKVMVWELSLQPLFRQALGDRLPPGPLVRGLYFGLQELMGNHGVIISQYPESIISFHALSPRLDPSVYLHQIESVLPGAGGNPLPGTTRIIQSGREADEYLSKKGLLFPP